VDSSIEEHGASRAPHLRLMLVRIVSETFVCGVVLDGERIDRCAPYLASCLRRSGRYDRAGLRDLVRRNPTWRAELVEVAKAP